MLIDTVFNEMANILNEKNVSKTASINDLKVNEISLISNTSDELNIPISSVSFERNVVASYDSEDKAILKEKGRAIEVGDIVDQAHPGTVVVAENYKGSGEVENQNQQRQKILDVINRTPTGFNFNTFAEKISEMMKVAEMLEESGDLNASVIIMNEAARLTKLKKKQFSKQADVPAEVDFGGIVPYSPPYPAKKPNDNSAIQSVKPLESKKPKPSNLQKRVFVPDDILSDDVKKNTRPEDRGKSFVTIDGEIVPPKHHSKSLVTTAPPKAPRNSGRIMAALVRALKSKGGIVMATLLAAGTIGTLIYNAVSEVSDPVNKLKESDNERVAALGQEMEKNMQNVVNSVQSGELNMALSGLDALERGLNQIHPHVIQNAEELQAVNSISTEIERLANTLTNEAQKVAIEKGKTVAEERKRIMGMQRFFKENYNEELPVTGIKDQYLQQALTAFVDSFSKSLAIAPKLLTVKNLLEVGTWDKLKQLKDIWDRPHLYVEREQ